MKKIMTLLLALALTLSCVSVAAATTVIHPNLYLKIDKPDVAENNPVIEGESPFTGLPMKDQNYTPILIVYDNGPIGFMHWGTGAADIIMRVPNQGCGNTKYLGLFASEYPEYAGGCRSARVTAVPFAFAFDSAFSSAGYPPVQTSSTKISVPYYLSAANYNAGEKWFDLIGGGSYAHREPGLPTSSSLLAHIREIHQIMVDKGIQFEKRPFLFTDTPLDHGDAASVVDLKFYDRAADMEAGHQYRGEESHSVFYYDEGVGYQHKMYKGIEMDRETGEVLEFANLIIMRSTYNSMQDHDGNSEYYTYPETMYVGSGQAEIFQNGRHITGAWYRDSLYSRLIFIDDEGNELQFQRGKTYIVVSNDHCVVSYDE